MNLRRQVERPEHLTIAQVSFYTPSANKGLCGLPRARAAIRETWRALPLTWLKRFAERPLTALGGLLASGSAAAIFGGWSDTAQAISRKLVGLPAVDVPLPLLVAMLVAGLDLVAFEQVYLVRRGATAGHRLLAIRHTSLNPSTVPHLRESELPKEGHTIQQRRLLHQQQAA